MVKSVSVRSGGLAGSQVSAESQGKDGATRHLDCGGRCVLTLNLLRREPTPSEGVRSEVGIHCVLPGVTQHKPFTCEK